MKKFIVVAFLATIGLMATDYTSYSAEELAAMRGSVAVEDKEAFQTALQDALAGLTTEERQAIMSKRGSRSAEALGTRSQSRQRARTRSHSAMDALNGGGAAGAAASAGMSGSVSGGMSGGMGGGFGGDMGGGMGGGGHGGGR